MPSINKDIDSYKVSYESRFGVTVVPTIYLFNKGKKFGEVNFYTVNGGEIDWTNPPFEAVHRIEADYITVNLHLDHFDRVYALLRAETNLELYMRPTSGKTLPPWTAMIRMKSEKSVGAAA